jgi:hypothetical protein
MTERKPDTGSERFVMLPAVCAGRMGVQNEMARMNRKARLCPNMFRVPQLDLREGAGQRNFIGLSGIQNNVPARPIPRSRLTGGAFDMLRPASQMNLQQNGGLSCSLTVWLFALASAPTLAVRGFDQSPERQRVGPESQQISRSTKSTIEHDPSGSVVARVFLSPNPSVYASVHESVAHSWREKEMIQPHPLV